MLSHLAPLAALLAAASLAAQNNSTASTTVGPAGVGCQGSGGLLTGGIAASMALTVHYDSSTGIAQLVVDNTSPVVPGEATAVITQICLNLPPSAITAAGLVGQAGSGGATPAFDLTFDGDTLGAPNPVAAACLGDFNVRLRVASAASGGIANPAATSIAAADPVFGPVTFTLQLAGPGVGGIDAEAILASFSQNAPLQQTNAAAEFAAAGIGGAEAGWVGTGARSRAGVYHVGPASIGQTVDVCATGDNGCHICIWASFVPGPATVLGYTLPIGLPLIDVFTLGYLGQNGATNELCFPIPIPNDSGLVGLSLYFTNLTFHVSTPSDVSFAPQHVLTVEGPQAAESVITGYKFFDHSEDGIWNPGVDPLEVPIVGWRVELLRNGVLDGVTFTDATGRYVFVRPQDGASYTVQEIAPGGFIGEGVPGATWLATTPRSAVVVANAPAVTGPDFGNLRFEVTPGVGRTRGFWHNLNGRALLEKCDPEWRDVLTVRDGVQICLRRNISTAVPSESIFTPLQPPATFAEAHDDFAAWIAGDSALGHGGFILSAQVAAAILNNECGFMQGTIYVDRRQNGILESFDDMIVGVTGLLCDPLAGLTGPHDPGQQLREQMLACINEFGSINSTGDLGEPQVVFGASSGPGTFRWPYER